MHFIGRKNELNKLNSEYNNDSSFVVIYGRRRVGKTTLIKELLKLACIFRRLYTVSGCYHNGRRLVLQQRDCDPLIT